MRTPQSGGEDRRAELLPPDLLPLFDDRFVRTCDLYEEFVFRLALQVYHEAQLEPHLGSPVDAAALVQLAGLDPEASRVPVDWMLRLFARRGLLEAHAGESVRYSTSAPIPALRPDEMLEAQRAHDASALPSYRIAAVAAQQYVAFLRGEVRGEAVLFAPDRIDLWADYFANGNSLYAVNNQVGATAIEEWVPAGQTVLLEVGGGLASGALAVLGQLERAGRLAEIERYLFTDVAMPLLRRGQRALAAKYPEAPFLATQRLDIDAPFAGQGIAEGSVGVVYGVNTLHVARNLHATLGEIWSCLRPGGRLIVAECVRPFPDDAVYVEFVFNMLEPFRAPQLDPRLRPHPGFLTPEQWQASLEAAGFEDVRFLPDVRRVREVYPAFVVGAVGATRP